MPRPSRKTTKAVFMKSFFKIYISKNFLNKPQPVKSWVNLRIMNLLKIKSQSNYTKLKLNQPKDRNSCFSLSLLFVKPKTSFPLALFHLKNSSPAPAKSPAFTFFNNVDFKKAPVPIL